MITTEEFLDNFLAHRAEYDPVKAREYYLRTRELKGRKPGQGDDPRSKVTEEGDPLPKLGTRMREDETPDVSPTGAKLKDYQAKGLGRAVYADGSVYDARTGWSKPGGPKPVLKRSEDRKRRIGAAEQKLIRAKSRANAIKDPVKKQALLQRISKTEKRLKVMLASKRPGVTE